MNFLLIVPFCLLGIAAGAQDKSLYKFKEVNPSDFQSAIYQIDSNASAVILADVGSTSFVGNRKGWFTLVFHRHTRIRILKKSAVGLATVNVEIYKKGDEEEVLDNVTASTFNESNGQVIETKLDKHDVFSEREDKNHTVKKFTLPAVKEGSIIDYSYTINSDFTFNLQPWTFQHRTYPCLWSEYSIAVPQLLNYIFLKQGFNKFFVDKKEESSQAYRVTQPSDGTYAGPPQDLLINANVQKCRWVMKDVIGFQDMDFLGSAANYLDKVEFQLSQVYNGEHVTDVMTTWPKAMEDLLNQEDFGKALTANNYWLEKDLQSVTDGLVDQQEIAEAIYAYVQKNFTCTGEGYFIHTQLQDVFKTRKGNGGEINLILIAMLRKKGIPSDPVLVSTRENGRAYKEYPILARYNHAFCRSLINDQSFFLDASRPMLAFGRLDPDCYYGQARVINKTADSFDLDADSLHENKNILVVVSSENGKFNGSVNKVPGYYESYHLRQEFAKNGSDYLLAGIRKQFSGDVQVDHMQIDSVTNIKVPVAIHYDFSSKPVTEDVYYLNPMFGEQYDKNMFKSEERQYPVEMFMPANTTYVLNLDVPQGYKVDELPKSVKVKLNEKGDGYFEYQIQLNESTIALRTRLVLKRTYFGPDEYDMLREFFRLIIKKQNELIVFKKLN